MSNISLRSGVAILVLSLLFSSACSPSRHESGDSDSPPAKVRDPESISERQSGPFIGGGGGEVAVCFGSAEIRGKSFADDGTLLPKGRDQILQIYSYDVFETRATLGMNSTPEDGETPVQFLDRHLAYLFTISPYFAYQLGSAIQLILGDRKDTLAWVDVGAIPSLGDAGERRLSESGFEFGHAGLYCQPTQIIRRVEIYENGRDQKPRVEIKVDADLFDRLNRLNNLPFPAVAHMKNAGVFHQSVLILHEALYLMTSYLGAKNSASSRDLLSTVLFDSNLFQKLMAPNADANPLSLKRRWHKKLLDSLVIFGLKDYAKIFSPMAITADFQNRPEDFRRALINVNQAVSEWLEKKASDLSQTFALTAVMRNSFAEDEAKYILGKLSAIEAYVYVSEVIWNTEPKEYIHYEFLFLLKDDKLKLIEKYYCERVGRYLDILNNKSETVQIYQVFRRAQQFCTI